MYKEQLLLPMNLNKPSNHFLQPLFGVSIFFVTPCSVPNKSVGRNKSTGWNIYQKLIKVRAEIIMHVGIFFKT